MSRRLVLALSVPLLLASCRWPFAAEPDTKSGSDDFRSNDLAEYTQHADASTGWSIADGRLLASGPGRQSVLIRNSSRLRDGWVEVDSDHADEGGIVLRFVDEDDYYLLAIRDDGSLLGTRNVEFFRRRSGKFKLLTTEVGKDLTWPRGVQRTVRFEANGNVLSVYVDGVLVDHVADPDPIMDTGRVGVRYHDVPEALGTDSTRYQALRWHAR